MIAPQPVNPERLFSRVMYVVAEQFETAREVCQEGAEEVSADRLIGFVSSPDAAGPAAKHSPPHQDVPNSAKGTTSMTQPQPGVTDAAAAGRVVDRSSSGRAHAERGTPVDSHSRSDRLRRDERVMIAMRTTADRTRTGKTTREVANTDTRVVGYSQTREHVGTSGSEAVGSGMDPTGVAALAMAVWGQEMAPPDWHADAACRGVDPGLFEAARGGSSAPAKRICATCPVRELCAADQERFELGGQRTRPTHRELATVRGGQSAADRHARYQSESTGRN